MYNKVNEICCGDCLELTKEIPDNYFDSFVTDPPYGLKFMGKDWDHGVPGEHFWKEFLRTAKPGAHLMAFGGTRTHHRLMVAIEDAGWEIRDCLMWVYGSGFPKSLDVGKAIDKAAGVEREVVGPIIRLGDKRAYVNNPSGNAPIDFIGGNDRGNLTSPTTDAAKQWDGWGTSLKPAYEIIILARKPLDGTVADTVLKWGCGGINVDGCRVALNGDKPRVANTEESKTNTYGWADGGGLYKSGTMPETGRFPANLIHDGSDEVLACFPQSNGQLAKVGPENGNKDSVNVFGDYGPRQDFKPRGDSGSAARFFYCAKASKSERGFGNTHPTVKPLALMQYLVRLITPPNGIICDPFVGSGSTAIAAIKEGFNYIGMDKDQSSVDIANRRIFDII